MAAPCLEFQHHLCETFGADFVLPFFPVVLTDDGVLTIHTAKVTITEKDVANTVRSHECGLFAEMRRVARDDGQVPRVTPRELIVQAVVTAVVRADVAGSKHGLEGSNTPGQLTGPMEPEI